MISATVTVKNQTGLHARPANVFVKEAMQYYDCSIFIRKNGRAFNAKSIVSVLAAYVKCGEEIEITADGTTEEKALQAMVDAVNAGLGE